MIKIKEAIIVEGKYDKIKLSSIFDTIIIKTDGFGVYKDKKTINLIKKLSEERGVIILTDSDNSGLMIRNYLKNVLAGYNVVNAFIPTIKGKEKRKKNASKDGYLGVEGIENDVILDTLMPYINEDKDKHEDKEKINKLDLYKLGIYGKDNSNIIRKKIINELNLPENMSVNMFLDVLNSLYDKPFLENFIKNIN